MSEQPLPDITIPTATSRFNPGGGFSGTWFPALAASIRVMGVEIRNQALAAVAALGQKLPQEIPNSDFAAVVTDQVGRISEGTRTTGEKYIAAADIGQARIRDLAAESFTQAGQGLAQVTGDYARITVDADGRMAEDALDGSGCVPDWVLVRWADRMGLAATRNLGIEPVRSLSAFGDSMTQGIGGGGTSWPSVAGAELGLPVYNGGVSGQTSSEVALRQGGLEVLLTATNNTIPASDPVAVTVTPEGIWRAGTAWTFPGALAGISGTLAKSASEAWTFTRAFPGAATLTPAGSRFISDTAKPYDGWLNVFWSGRNNINPSVIERDTAAMIAALTPLKRRYLVLSVCNTASEASGTSGHTTVAAINTALQNTYGANYVDIRRYLIDYGLQAAGIAPTAADTTAINEDRIPPSLMSDTIHLNAAGYTVVGKRIAAVLREKSWA